MGDLGISSKSASSYYHGEHEHEVIELDHQHKLPHNARRMDLKEKKRTRAV